MKHIVLLSKDATLPEYFGPYGAKYIKTPNIDKIAKKGTVFLKHYTAAPSTAMAFSAMFTGRFSYTMPYKRYKEVPPYEGKTLFDELSNSGYECHLLWSTNYVSKAERYSKCFGKNTIHHEMKYFNEHCGANADFNKKNRERNEDIAEAVIDYILSEVDSIDYQNKNIFLWIHMPHCIKGRISYGDDIDIFDNLVGELVKRFGDENFYITADHGHMNGLKGRVGYGFHVYNSAIHIPLITPKIDNLDFVDFPTSNVQLSDLIINKRINRLEYLYSDSAYYAQKTRKLAIIKGNYHYIFTKKGKKEELYDVELDPSESINLAKGWFRKDKERNCKVDIRQLIQYPYWDRVDSVLRELREQKNKVWRNGSFVEETYFATRFKLIDIYKFFSRIFRKVFKRKK